MLHNFNRLFLLLFTGTLISCGGLKKHYSGAEKIVTSFATWQGVTTNTVAQISFLLPSSVSVDLGSDRYQKANDTFYNYRLQVFDDEGNNYSSADITGKEFTQTGALWKVLRIQVSGLEKASKYQFKIFDEANVLIERRNFKTLDLSGVEISFIASSCMSDSFRYRQRQKNLWEKVSEQAKDVDFIVLNGDNVYVDSFEVFGKNGKPESSLQIWNRYVDHFRSTELFYWNELVPVLATWDDHDFGINDGDSSWELSKSSLKVFKSFFGAPNRADIFENSVGVASRFMGMGHNLIFLDNRSFRSSAQSQKKYPHFGPEQGDWLVKILRESEPSFIFNGGQFFGGYSPKESFESSHPEGFSSWVKRVKKETSAPFVLVSGDLHFTETMRIEREAFGFSTYEMTLSSWHSRFKSPWSKKYKNNPRRINDFTTENFNFTKIRSKRLTGGGFSYESGKLWRDQ